MTDFLPFTVAAWPRRCCPPGDHLLTVVGTRRVRDGLGKRYWIRCRFCDFEHGPYDSWRAAWLDALGAQIAARQHAVSRERSLAQQRRMTP
jgi:hypothetical protein